MPIVAVTGLPGHGKTLYTIARWKLEGEKSGRPIFFSGIKGLTLPWQEWEPEKWEELPPGAIFIIDEAQFRLKVHGRGQLPPWIERLSVHRHAGLDLVLITQNPMMLDPFVRRLIDRHFHVSRKWGRQSAVVHEFPNGVNDNVAKVRKGSIRHDWRYPRVAFTWYQSAELHTVEARVPMKMYVIPGMAVLFLGAAGLAAWRMVPSNVVAQTQGHPVAAPGTSGGLVPQQAGAESGARGKGERMTTAEYVQAYTPRFEGLAHTAPIYDGVTQPREAPYPAACLASAKRCQCYSQQGTRLDMPDHLCRQLADGGFFVAWTATGDRVQASQARAGAATPAAAAPAALGSQAAPPAPPQFVAATVEPDAGSLPRRVRRVAQ